MQFEAELNGGRLLLASDGLIKYSTVEQICALATEGTVSEAANALTNSVCLPSGALQDDVAALDGPVVKGQQYVDARPARGGLLLVLRVRVHGRPFSTRV